VAYTVGFTAPSYFTKCFKEEYGMVPGDVRK
jgi:AraC-like DNA-binding protein